MFGDGGRHHMELYGTTKEQFAKVSVKNHRHSVNNPRSQYQEACTLEEVLASREVYDPLTLLQCCPTSDGAGAAVLCSKEFAAKHGHSNPVKIIGQAMRTDLANVANVTYVSLLQGLCDPSGCLAVVPGSPNNDLMTFDFGHLSPKGSEYVARTLIGGAIQ